MTRRKSGEPEQKRIHVWLFKDDIDTMKRVFGDSVGFSRAIRTIIHREAVRIEKKVAAQTGVQAVPVDLGDEEEAGAED